MSFFTLFQRDVSQSRNVLSSEALSKKAPSGSNATDFTVPLWRVSFLTGSPLSFTTSITLPLPIPAIHLPSALTAMRFQCDLCWTSFFSVPVRSQKRTWLARLLHVSVTY